MSDRHSTEIAAAANEHGLDPALVAALVSVESSGDPWAVRFEPHYRWLLGPDGQPMPLDSSHAMKRPDELSWTDFVGQKTSWGLMQVMGAVARELGFAGFFPRLCEPSVGLHYGCLLLARLVERYGLRDGVAAYNAGPGGRHGEAGQAYASKVLGRIPDPVDPDPLSAGAMQ